jgi:hypothetical protein
MSSFHTRSLGYGYLILAELHTALIIDMHLSGTIASIIRIKYLVNINRGVDPTWDDIESVFWTMIESDVAIICICLPAIHSLYKHVTRSKATSTNNSNSNGNSRSKSTSKSNSKNHLVTFGSSGNPISRSKDKNQYDRFDEEAGLGDISKDSSEFTVKSIGTSETTEKGDHDPYNIELSTFQSVSR